MKKNLIVALALVFVLGIAGTAFAAANPFVDVPAKHWAYDAVTKLAQAGILDGYGDGTYRGERLATRYELAQATAKAMARADKADAQMKALIDKLAVEFAAELNNLGVRVAKLEKNASSIKFWGDSRIRYQSGFGGSYEDQISFQGPPIKYDVSKLTDPASPIDIRGFQFVNPVTPSTGPSIFEGQTASNTGWRTYNARHSGSRFNQRIRIYTKADLNDKAAFYGRLMAEWTDRPDSMGSGTQGTEVYWDFGYFEWTFNPGLKVAVGRQQVIGAMDMFWTNGGYDGVQFKFGGPSDKLQAKIGYGDVGSYANYATSTPPQTAKIARELLLADVNYKISDKWALNAAAYWMTNDKKFGAYTFPSDPWNIYNHINALGAAIAPNAFQVWTVGFQGKLSDDFKLKAAYVQNASSRAKDINNALGFKDPNGWYGEVWYKGADRAKVGSWGLSVNYRNFAPFALDWANASGVFNNSMTGMNTYLGVKGWGFQGNYTISKNAVLTATYESLKRNTGHGFLDRSVEPFYYVQLNVNF